MEGWNPGRHDVSGSVHANLVAGFPFRHDEPCVFILYGRAQAYESLLNVYRLLKPNLFLLVEAIGIAASVEFLDEAQVGKVLGLGRFCLGIFFRQRS
jgi:hypothetical protein